MPEEDGVTISGHISVHKEGGLTVEDLRLLLAAVDKAGFPDTAEVRVRTMWRTNEHGTKVRKMTAVVPK